MALCPNQMRIGSKKSAKLEAVNKTGPSINCEDGIKNTNRAPINAQYSWLHNFFSSIKVAANKSRETIQGKYSGRLIGFIKPKRVAESNTAVYPA